MLHTVPCMRHSLPLLEDEESGPRHDWNVLAFFSISRREFTSSLSIIRCIAAGDERQKLSESKLGSQVREGEVDGVYAISEESLNTIIACNKWHLSMSIILIASSTKREDVELSTIYIPIGWSRLVPILL